MDDQKRGKIKQLYLAGPNESQNLFRYMVSDSDLQNRNASFAYLEKCVTEKRLEWWKKYRQNACFSGNSVLDAFEMFYFNYLRLSIPLDGEIVLKTENKIISRWWNPCPTLDTCQALKLDTREICMRIYEKPVQVLISQIHPDLKFMRNYHSIRPYESYCEEIILLDAAD